MIIQTTLVISALHVQRNSMKQARLWTSAQPLLLSPLLFFRGCFQRAGGDASIYDLAEWGIWRVLTGTVHRHYCSQLNWFMDMAAHSQLRVEPLSKPLERWSVLRFFGGS